MKNIFLAFFAFFALTLSAFAQTEPTYKPMLSTTTGLALDTVTNTGARSQVLRLAGPNTIITIISTVTEITGTTAGTVKLYGSLDGVNYAEINSSNVFSPADILTAQSYAWHVNPSQYTYYKVTYTGTGTMAAKLATGVLRR